MAAMSSGGGFLPRVQFLSGNSDKVKKKEFPMDHFAFILGKNKYEDLGEEFDCLVVAMRPKALDTSDPDGIITCHDPKLEDKKFTGTFADIADRAGKKDSGCMFGPEYLLWIPAKAAFATMFFCNPSLRNEAPNMQAKLGNAATIGYQYIDTGKFQYNSPAIKDCTTVFDLPTQEAVNDECQKFLNPQLDDNGVEIVNEKEEAAKTDKAKAGTDRPQ
jgi:hypothetical protein